MSPDSNRRRVLHIITRPDDRLARNVIDQQRQLENIELDIVDFSRDEPDYVQLLDQIFAAESVNVW